MIDISSFTEKLPFEGAFALARIQSLTPKALNRLSNEQRHELETFTNLKRQQEYVTSRLLLQQLAEKMGAGKEEFFLKKNELGQPFGRINSMEYNVSIAHTKDLVFCGITEDRAIGLDLEPADRTIGDRLKRRMVHKKESESVRGMDTIKLWTLKEAVLKLFGSGLRMNMSDVRIEAKDGEYYAELNNDKRAKILSFRSENNWLAIAFFININ